MSEDKVYAYTSELKHLRIRANLKQTFFFPEDVKYQQKNQSMLVY